MPCTAPIRGVRDRDGVVRLRRGVADARLFGTGKNPELELPCGRCLDCKIKRSGDWAVRAVHEASLHDRNCFLTLTFSDEGLALRELQNGTHPFDLDVADWQGFAKRLRQELTRQQRRFEKQMGLPKQPVKGFRFFQVGEYGDEGNRPHYHALIFGQDFTGEGELWKDNKGNPKWRSSSVEKCWPYGFAELGELTPETINYVCRYVTKKLYGPKAIEALERIDSHTGEIVTVRPELATMSRGGRSKLGGIGSRWIDQWLEDTFKDDSVIIKGKRTAVPRYYTKRLEQKDKDLFEVIRQQREEKAKKRAAHNTPERRAVRAQVTKAKAALKKRREL